MYKLDKGLTSVAVNDGLCDRQRLIQVAQPVVINYSKEDREIYAQSSTKNVVA